MQEIIDQLVEKYRKTDENPLVYLTGLLHAKPITYWDYVEVDTLLTLQKPRTEFKDEFIFIIYHQITELVLRLIYHELEQMTSADADPSTFLEKVERINRYTGLLTNSFDIMSKGMSYEDYNTFRLTLTPASGFQSAQFRKIELMCTDIDKLINERGRQRMPEACTLNEKFNYLYWQDAGKDHKTGKKSQLLRLFEEKYLAEFQQLAQKMETQNLSAIARRIDFTKEEFAPLKVALRQMDINYNIEWPMVHLNTAKTYLLKKGEATAATGGSEWQKYLHPAYQRRMFFPELFTSEEREQWAKHLL